MKVWKRGQHNMCEMLDRMVNEGVQQGAEIVTHLFQNLFLLNGADDVKRATEDVEYLHKLMKEFHVSPNEM